MQPLWRPPLLRSKPTFASVSIMCFSSSEPARPRDDDEQVRGRRRRHAAGRLLELALGRIHLRQKSSPGQNLDRTRTELDRVLSFC